MTTREQKKLILKDIEKLRKVNVKSIAKKIHVDPSNIYTGRASIKTLIELREALIEELILIIEEIENETEVL